jgi:hypothetical protein
MESLVLDVIGILDAYGKTGLSKGFPGGYGVHLAPPCCQ